MVSEMEFYYSTSPERRIGYLKEFGTKSEDKTAMLIKSSEETIALLTGLTIVHT